MSELQKTTEETTQTTEQQPGGEGNSTEVKPGETGADLATDSPETGGEENTENGAEQEAIQKAINRQHFKFREEQRRADELAVENEKLKKQLQSQSPSDPNGIEIPPIPDMWDDNYEAKVQAREDAIRRKAVAEAQATQSTQNAALEEQKQQLKQAQRSQQLQDKFVDNAAKLGVDGEALNAAQNTIIQYGITPELATTILQDDNGPLLVQHLAANPLDLHDLVTLEPLQAGMKLAEVKQKAAALKPKRSEAPPPADTLTGRGAKEGERGPKGATFT